MSHRTEQHHDERAVVSPRLVSACGIVTRSDIVLPSLHEAIPEFHSHTPSRRLGGSPRPISRSTPPLTSISLLPLARPFSPTPSASFSELSGAGNTFSSPTTKRRRLSYQAAISVGRTSQEPGHWTSLEAEHRGQGHNWIPALRTTDTSPFGEELPVDHSLISPSHYRPSKPSSPAISAVALQPLRPDPNSGSRHPEQKMPLLSHDNATSFVSPFEHRRISSHTTPAFGEYQSREVPRSSPPLKNFSPVSPRERTRSFAMPHQGQSSLLPRMTTLHGPSGSDNINSYASVMNHAPVQHHFQEHASNDGGDYDHTKLGKRRRGNLPKPVTDLLRSWLHAHINHPYPTEDQKQELVAQTGLTMNQISNWFINARRRRLPVLSTPTRTGHDPQMMRHLGPMETS